MLTVINSMPSHQRASHSRAANVDDLNTEWRSVIPDTSHHTLCGQESTPPTVAALRYAQLTINLLYNIIHTYMYVCVHSQTHAHSP